MKVTTVLSGILVFLLVLPVTVLATGPDDYLGDTSIYGASTVTVKPNILVILDSSGSMGDPIPVSVCTADSTDTDLDGIADKVDNCPTIYNPIASGQTYQADSDKDNIGDVCEASATPPVSTDGDYDKDTDYTVLKKCGSSLTSSCTTDQVYLCDWNATTEKCDSLTTTSLPTTDKLPATCTIKTTLINYGTVSGSTEITYSSKKKAYSCTATSSNFRYYTGNYLNWYFGKISKPPIYTVKLCNFIWKDKTDIAKTVVKDLVSTTQSVNLGLMVYNNGSSSQGAKFLTSGGYTTTVKDMDALFSPSTDATTTNRDMLLAVVDTVPASGYTPLGESLLEAARYFGGQASAFQTGVSYTSPISASCQTNHIIFVTDGMSTSDDSAVLKTICTNGDCDGDGKEPTDLSHSLDDVAKYLYSNDFSSKNGIQNVKSYFIGFNLSSTNSSEAEAIALLNRAAINGTGNPDAVAYMSTDYKTLSKAFSSIINNIQETNSSFVAPVVPTSPENRAYSGDRVYLGFFKPMRDLAWRGNIKKFSLRNDGAVLDKNGNVATDSGGAFLSTSVSYWGSDANPDGPNVDQGGVGGALLARDFYRTDATTPTAPRMIYTDFTGTDLTATENHFVKTNASLTAAVLGGLADATERDKLIDYIHGIDAYDDDGDGKTNEKRAWILGDILHFKPLIVNYNRYTFNSANESNVNINKTMIYVGSNDGQLHAFRDADAKELWSYIPKSSLAHLRDLYEVEHQYFVDASPAVWKYDADNDGNVGPGPETAAADTDPPSITDSDTLNGKKDKVIVIFGMGRGAGKNNLLPDSPSIVSRGFYTALDLTDPEKPVFLWTIDNTTSGFSELGETWSEPAIAKVRIGTATKVVAFVGAGYDNNEDMRFGNTDTYPDTTSTTTDTSESDVGRGNVSSPGTSDQYNPKGRGIYALELATLDSNGKLISIATTPTKVWEYVYSGARTTDNPTCSTTSDVAVVDSDYNEYTDTLYFGDSCSTMWRCKVYSTTTDNWSCTKIFTAASPVGGTVGRKILYKPSVTLDIGKNGRFYNGVYFGTGDRSHPLNEGTVDRMYAVWDYRAYALPASEEADGALYPVASEANMEDVTENDLQAAAPPTGVSPCVAGDKRIACILKRLSDPLTNRGWFIRLNENAGEKVLAAPTLFNKVAYFTTFTPQYSTTDTCKPGDLGVGRVYALKYKTGEAVLNYDDSNDGESTAYNSRGSGGEGVVLRRSDRVLTIASGIPSGVVIYVPQDGAPRALIGCGGGLCGSETSRERPTFPIYWMVK